MSYLLLADQYFDGKEWLELQIGENFPDLVNTQTISYQDIEQVLTFLATKNPRIKISPEVKIEDLPGILDEYENTIVPRMIVVYGGGFKIVWRE